MTLETSDVPARPAPPVPAPPAPGASSLPPAGGARTGRDDGTRLVTRAFSLFYGTHQALKRISIEIPDDSARRLISGVTPAERNRYIVAAANWAMQQPAAQQKYAVIGYCWGGSTTFMHAIHQGVKGFSGGVAFYGLPYTAGGAPATATTPAVPATIVADSIARIKVPVMLLNGSRDARISAAMPALDSLMKAMGKEYSGSNYEGATHGFLARRNEAAKDADLEASKDAWPRTIAFLKKNLGVK